MKQDANLLIMPGAILVDGAGSVAEMARYLDDDRLESPSSVPERFDGTTGRTVREDAATLKSIASESEGGMSRR
ncbi:MAG: hypothetical protein J4F44_03735 [Acidimicrobiia bacterium]|nr:hypothetical protein [Acidimicrobiia bacterium]